MNLKPFTLAVAYWIAIILAAHLFAPPGYLWTQNTISELASQGHPYKWIMQAGLGGFGGLVVLAVGLSFFKTRKVTYPLLPIALYGFAILLSGIYCAAPIDSSIPYSISEAKLHSAFATTAGLSLSLGIFWRIFRSSNDGERLAHSIFLTAVFALSVLFGLAEDGTIAIGKGIVQRLLYMSGFAWLIYQEYLLAYTSHDSLQ
jgi:hypothetical membrane protein